MHSSNGLYNTRYLIKRNPKSVQGSINVFLQWMLRWKQSRTICAYRKEYQSHGANTPNIASLKYFRHKILIRLQPWNDLYWEPHHGTDAEDSSLQTIRSLLCATNHAAEALHIAHCSKITCIREKNKDCNKGLGAEVNRVGETHRSISPVITGREITLSS